MSGNNINIGGGAPHHQQGGPQLTFDKSYLCMIAQKGDIKEDSGKIEPGTHLFVVRSDCEEHRVDDCHLRVEEDHPR